MRVLRGLIASVSHFSVLPVSSGDQPPDAYVIGWLPLVGALVGYAAGWGAYGTFLLTHSQLWCAIAAFSLSVILTGAIHIDGFLDSCDALLASTTGERRLEILKDPRHGTFAIVGMALLTVVWFASLYDLQPQAMPLILAYAALLARAASLVWIGAFKHARTGERMQALSFVGWGWLALVLSGIDRAIGFTPTLIPVALFVSAFWAWLASRRIGGLTGDVYGALIVLTEVALLKLFALYPWLVK